MTSQREQEFAVIRRINFHGLIIRTSEKQLTVGRERNGSDGVLVRSHDMRETLHRVVPEPDSTICTSRGDDVSWSDGLDIVDWALVSDKSVGSRSW